MRKTLIGLLIASTMVTPAAASAQTVRADRGEARAQRQEQRQQRQAQPRAVDHRQRQERQVVRQQRQEQRGAVLTDAQRQERQDARRQRQLQRPAAATIDARRQQPVEGRLERRNDRRDARIERRDDIRDARIERRDDRRDARIERRADRRDWNRDWRQDRRYDWQRYRYANRNIYRIGTYYAPFRHSYSRFSAGYRLGAPFYANRYWIADPWQYRLPAAYAGTRWVRYYDDVLLVDLYTGEVVDVIYDFFW
jgi:Ni/Co efflux regulator RcnB